MPDTPAMTEERLREIEERVRLAGTLTEAEDPKCVGLAYWEDGTTLIAALRAEREENNRLRQREARLEKAWLTERSQLLWLDEMTQGRFSWNDVTEFDRARYHRQAGRGLTGTLGADS